MSQLRVRKVPKSLVERLKARALEHGVSTEEEHRRILRAALPPQPAKRPKGYTLFDHIRKLGEIAPDFEFVRERTRQPRRKSEL